LGSLAFGYSYLAFSRLIKITVYLLYLIVIYGLHAVIVHYVFNSATHEVPSATPSFGHESVKGWLREVGELLGYHVVAEYVSDYRFDVAWWSSEGDFRGEAPCSGLRGSV